MRGVVIYTDGGARGNPGPAGAAAVIYRDGEVLAEIKRYLGERTNNWAEYEALILALGEARARGAVAEPFQVRMDSELIVKQMRGEYKVKDANLKQQHARARELLAGCVATFTHIPREENAEADRLVNEAIDEAQ